MLFFYPLDFTFVCPTGKRIRKRRREREFEERVSEKREPNKKSHLAISKKTTKTKCIRNHRLLRPRRGV